MKYSKVILQIAFLCGMAWLGTIVSRQLGLSIPGNILGILFLFLALQFRLIPLKWVEAGAGLLIAELVLFFIPSAVAVMQFETLMKQEGLEFVLVIGISTLGVMLLVGLVTEKMLHYRERR